MNRIVKAWDGRWLRLAALLLLLPIAACNVKLERLNVSMAPDRRTSYSALMTASGRGDLQSYADDFRQCGIDANVFRSNTGEYRLDLQIPNVEPDAIERYLTCVPSGFRPSSSPSQYDGLFYTYYRLEFQIEGSRCRVSHDRSNNITVAGERVSFPDHLRFTMPGVIHSTLIEMEAPNFGYNLEQPATSDSQASFTRGYYQGDPNCEQYRAAFLESARGDAPRSERSTGYGRTGARFVIESRVPRYSIDTIIAVVALGLSLIILMLTILWRNRHHAPTP